jgi:hypothetical protein
MLVNATTGEPVKKARIILRALGATNSIPYATTTDSAGHFLIDAVDAGRYDLEASHSGFVNQSYSPQGDPSHRAVLTLEPGQKMKEIVFKILPQGVISGRTLDEDGDPVSGVTIECLRLEYQYGTRRLSPQDSTTTNDLGEFRLPVSNARRCILSATDQAQDMHQRVRERPLANSRDIQAGVERYITTYYPNSSTPRNATQVDVPPGAQIRGINITLIRARTVRIRGRVIGGPSADSRRMAVSLYPREEPAWNPGFPVVSPDRQGAFQLDGVVPGSYFLEADSVADGKRYSARTPIEVRDENIESIELTLQPPAVIQGRIALEGAWKDATPRLLLHSKSSEYGMGGRWVHFKRRPHFQGRRPQARIV